MQFLKYIMSLFSGKENYGQTMEDSIQDDVMKVLLLLASALLALMVLLAFRQQDIFGDF